MRKIATWLLKIFGWKIDEHAPEGVKKCVMKNKKNTNKQCLLWSLDNWYRTLF
jgi:hypothetical protein